MDDPGPGCAYVDDAYVALADAKLSLFDWGFLHSDATYDVAHVWHGRFFRLGDHLARFRAGLTRLRLDPGRDDAAIASILVECVRRAGLRDAYVEMGCTRGLPQPGSRDPRTCRNRFFAFAIPFVWIADPERQQIGLDLHVSSRQRIPPESVDPVVKNYHWLDLVMAQYDGYERGADSAIVVDAAGNLIEGPGFNVFIANRGELVTPARGALEGITRRTVLELAAASGFAVAERALPAAEARAADEVFLTSTAGGVIPVTRLDGDAVGDGLPGPMTLELRRRYWALHDQPEYTTAIDYDRGD